jgi:hypothetical protein
MPSADSESPSQSDSESRVSLSPSAVSDSDPATVSYLSCKPPARAASSCTTAATRSKARRPGRVQRFAGPGRVTAGRHYLRSFSLRRRAVSEGGGGGGGACARRTKWRFRPSGRRGGAGGRGKLARATAVCPPPPSIRVPRHLGRPAPEEALDDAPPPPAPPSRRRGWRGCAGDTVTQARAVTQAPRDHARPTRKQLSARAAPANCSQAAPHHRRAALAAMRTDDSGRVASSSPGPGRADRFGPWDGAVRVRADRAGVGPGPGRLPTEVALGAVGGAVRPGGAGPAGPGRAGCRAGRPGCGGVAGAPVSRGA